MRVVHLHRAYEARLGHTRRGPISGIVYARGKAPHVRPHTQQTCTEPACPVLYNNGPVQLTPQIYLLLWGPNWSTDPAEESTAQYLERFYGGLGVRQQGQPKDNWSTIISQYGDSSGAPIFSHSVLVGGTAFLDNTTPPTGATQAQIAAEADAFAATQGITDLVDAQIVVATQHGTCPAGFFAPFCGGTGTYCAWHSSSNEPYVNLPYLLDAGTSCGENFVNSGPAGLDDGFSLVGGAEYADTITNPEPNGIAPGTSPDPAWVDTGDTVSGGEVAQKCAFDQPFASNAPHGDVTLSTGSFAMQSLWSNDAGACVLSDTVTITNPGGQSNVAGSNVNLQLVGNSSAGYPLMWSSTPLPPGLTMSSAGLITGIPSTIGTYGVTVTAADAAGTSRGVSFIWTITADGKPITGPNSKCLDDFGAGTADRTKVDIWTCNNTAAQDWTFSGGALGVLGKCLDDVTGGGSGSPLVIFTCNGHKAQTWSHRSNGEYVLKLNGECLTDPGNSSVDGTQVEIRNCKNASDQHWSLP